MTTHCQYCTTILCAGCQAKLKSMTYVTTVQTCHTNPIESWLRLNSRGFTPEESKAHSELLKKQSVVVRKLYDV